MNCSNFKTSNIPCVDTLQENDSQDTSSCSKKAAQDLIINGTNKSCASCLQSLEPSSSSSVEIRFQIVKQFLPLWPCPCPGTWLDFYRGQLPAVELFLPLRRQRRHTEKVDQVHAAAAANFARPSPASSLSEMVLKWKYNFDVDDDICLE